MCRGSGAGCGLVAVQVQALAVLVWCALGCLALYVFVMLALYVLYVSACMCGGNEVWYGRVLGAGSCLFSLFVWFSLFVPCGNKSRDLV